jgi:DNA-binding FadR family transcriptional regulator
MDAIRRAYESIKKQLESGTWTHGARLPSLAVLAKSCLVSRSTMWKAVGLLKKESLLHTRKRGGIFSGPEGAGETGASRQTYGWLRVKIRIGHDLISGNFPAGVLPPMNKLSLQYGIALNTVRKTLCALENDGVLKREGRQYHQVVNRTLASSRAMVLIAAGDGGHQIGLGDWRIQRVADSFERECVRLSYESRSIGFQHDSTDALLQFAAALKPIKEIGGFIVSMWHPGNQVRWKRWMDLLSLLDSRGKTGYHHRSGRGTCLPAGNPQEPHHPGPAHLRRTGGRRGGRCAHPPRVHQLCLYLRVFSFRMGEKKIRRSFPACEAIRPTPCIRKTVCA